MRPGAAAIGLALFLAGCVSTPPPPRLPDGGEAPRGWAEEDHAAAFEVYRRTCRTARAPAGKRACAAALGGPERLTPEEARRFFEREFRFEPVEGEGRLTAYYAPEYAARTTPNAEFSAPVRPRPDDLEMVDGARLNPPVAGRVAARLREDGTYERYPARAEIEAASGLALAWMRPEDHFFMQLQGSGYLTFPDGRRARAAYAADNGRPFAGLAKPMIERGLLPPNGGSNAAISAWLAARRGPEAQEIMNLNPRFAFFTLQPDDARDPAGAAGLPLAVGRTVAVDPAHHRMGDLLWIEADGDNLPGATRSYRGLVVALDTGGAIKGEVRADLYLGRGAEAGEEAARVRHPLVIRRLVPRD